jgi:hypothetical protein
MTGDAMHCATHAPPHRATVHWACAPRRCKQSEAKRNPSMKRLALVMALVLAGAVRADANCWAPSVMEPLANDGLPITHASFKPLHAAMDQIEQQMRPNPGLLALPEVRLRIRRQVMGALEPARMPREAVIHAQGFGPKAWGRGHCELIAQADRLGPRAGISVFINTPTATLNRWEHDEQLTTYLARGATPSFQGWPTFGECALLSAGRRLPWVPVSVGEMLALFERQQQRQLADWDRQHDDAFRPFDLAKAEREAVTLSAQNASAAEAMLHGARQRKALEAQAHQALRAQRAHLAAALAELRTTQAALSPAQRDAPYHVGSGRHRLPTPDQASQHTVVKLDPAFAWDGRQRSRVQLLTVCAPQIERDPRYHPPMRDAVAALDFARLAALLN